MVEVEGSCRRVQGEIIAVDEGARSDSCQARSPIRCHVDRLRDDSVQLHNAAPVFTHRTRPEGEIQNHVPPFGYEFAQPPPKVVIQIELHWFRKRHESEATIPRLLVEREPDHATGLETSCNGRFARTRGAAHENDSHHDPTLALPTACLTKSAGGSVVVARLRRQRVGSRFCGDQGKADVERGGSGPIESARRGDSANVTSGTPLPSTSWWIFVDSPPASGQYRDQAARRPDSGNSIQPPVVRVMPRPDRPPRAKTSGRSRHATPVR